MSAIGATADKGRFWPRDGLSANDPKQTLGSPMLSPYNFAQIFSQTLWILPIWHEKMVNVCDRWMMFGLLSANEL
jgi:hypothetical protein